MFSLFYSEQETETFWTCTDGKEGQEFGHSGIFKVKAARIILENEKL